MATLDWRPDRRRSPRVDLLADLQGHLVTLDERVEVRQVSAGGLTVAMNAPLSPHLTHDFRLTFDGRTAVVRAELRHARVEVTNDEVAYVSGLQFVDLSEDARALVAAILERAGAGDAGDNI